MFWSNCRKTMCSCIAMLSIGWSWLCYEAMFAMPGKQIFQVIHIPRVRWEEIKGKLARKGKLEEMQCSEIKRNEFGYPVREWK